MGNSVVPKFNKVKGCRVLLRIDGVIRVEVSSSLSPSVVGSHPRSGSGQLLVILGGDLAPVLELVPALAEQQPAEGRRLRFGRVKVVRIVR